MGSPVKKVKAPKKPTKFLNVTFTFTSSAGKKTVRKVTVPVTVPVKNAEKFLAGLSVVGPEETK